MKDFCGFKNGTTFVLWNNNDFGSCFQLFCLVCPANFFLACSSIFFASGKRQRFDLLDCRRLYLLSKLQASISCLICLESVLEALCSWLLKSYHPPVYLLTCSLISLAWISNAVNVWRNRHVILLKKCYATVHVGIIILAFLVTTIQFYSVTLRIQDDGFNSLFIREYGTICRISLQIIFLILLIPPACSNHNRIGRNADLVSSTTTSASIQGGSERDALLRSASRGTFYSGTQCITDDLGVAEDGSNFLSKLTFWWVRPMMMKGFKGNLQCVEDLFLLPQSLSTKKLRIIFSANFDCLTTDQNAPDNVEDSCSSDSAYGGIKFLPGVQKSVSDPDFRRSSAIRRLTSDGSYTSTEFSEKGATDIPGPKVTKQRSLLSALHHSFGRQYYCVGLLKLTGDALSFSGPLLLHALVSFMENRQVSYLSLCCIRFIIEHSPSSQVCKSDRRCSLILYLFTCCISGTYVSWLLLCFRIVSGGILCGICQFTVQLLGE